MTRTRGLSIVPRKPIVNFDTDVERPHLPATAHETACRSCNLSAQTSRAHGPLPGLSRASRKLSGAGPIRRPAGRSGAGVCRARVSQLSPMRNSQLWLRKGKVRGLWTRFFGRVFLSRSNRMPSDSERHRLFGSKAAVIKRWAQQGATPCLPMQPLRAAWVEQASKKIKLCKLGRAVLSCGSKGEPELRSRHLLAKSGEAYLEAALEQGVEN